MLKNVEAVIFDLDGTLWINIWRVEEEGMLWSSIASESLA